MPAVLRVLALTVSVSLAACSTARVGQFRQYAETGIAYADAIDVLMLEAGGTAPDADPAALARARDALPQAERARVVLDHDELLAERLELLRDLQRHAALLRDYFLLLAALAESDAASAAAAGTEDLVAAIQALGERLGAARLGGEPVSAIAGDVAEITVARFQRSVLDRELEARAALMLRELDLQQAAMEAIAGQLRVDLEIVAGYQRLRDVVDPYRSGNKLPKTWAKRRREIMMATAAAESAQAAVAAAASLKRSFEALAANRYTLSDFQAVMADVNRIVTLLEHVSALDAGG
jgi:hypothetical protein